MKVDMKGEGTQQQQCKMKVSSHCFSKISKLSSCKVLKNILKKSQSRISAVCLLHTHYWKSLIFVHKFNLITSFSPNFFLTIFLVKSKLSIAKRSQTITFSRVFHPPKKIDNFLVKIKVVNS